MTAGQFCLGGIGLIWRYLSTLDAFETVLAPGGIEAAVRKRLDDAYAEQLPGAPNLR